MRTASPSLSYFLLAAFVSSCGGAAPPRETSAKPAPSASASPARSAKEVAPAASSATLVSAPPAPSSKDEPDFHAMSRSAFGFSVHRKDGGLVVLDKNRGVVLAFKEYEGATFDETGKALLAWNKKGMALFEIPSGGKIAEKGEGFEGKAAFLPGGKRVIVLAEGVGIRFYEVPSLQKTFEKLGQSASEYHQTAKRAFLISDLAVKDGDGINLKLFLIDTESEKILGSIPMNEAFVHMPQFAFSADGKKLAWINGDTRVWDTTTNKIILLDKGGLPDHPRDEPGPPYFSADGHSVCIAQSGDRRAISIRKQPNGTARHCFFTARGKGAWIAEASTGDTQSILVDIPVTKGMRHAPNSYGLYFHVRNEDMSPDGSAVAVIEQADVTGTDGDVDLWLILAHSRTGNIIHRLPLFRQSYQTHVFDVSFTKDGKHVEAWNGDKRVGKAFEVETGREIDPKTLDVSAFPADAFSE